nr:unnamed protein product [Callosobruchus chinensis]
MKIAYRFTKPRILGTLFVPPSSTRVTSNPFRSAVMFSAQRTGNVIYRVGESFRS